nr:hypothetical protein [Borrelia hermsii]
MALEIGVGPQRRDRKLMRLNQLEPVTDASILQAMIKDNGDVLLN